MKILYTLDLINKFNKITYKIINVLISFSLYITFSYIINHRIIHLEPIYKKIYEFENIYTSSFLYSFFIENEVSKIKKFWKNNAKNELIDNNYLKNYKKKDIPDISVIITVFNQVNCFYKALRSVQNQSLQNIEIILVDDCSSDNSFEMIEYYQKEDDRIILLKHQYNLGKIKSRTDAIKLSKGKYILIIDGDDGLTSPDILNNCFQIANIGFLDIVEFKMAYFKNKYLKRIENNLAPIKNLNNRIIYQPELKYKFIKVTGLEKLWNYLNRSICSKLIKNEIFQKVVNFIGPKYTQDYIVLFEDIIMSSALFFLSNSYYLMKQPGYYRSKNECFESSNKSVEKRCGYHNCIINIELDSIKYLNFLLDKFNNGTISGELIYNELLTIDYHYNLYKTINNNFYYVYNVLDNILSKFKYFTDIQKNRIINLKKQLIKKEKEKINI